jgi:hypothetical protein
MPFRSHCRPKTSSSDPITSCSAPIGTFVSAVPNAPTSSVSAARPAPAPSQVERQPRTLPTPTTMMTISMTSTAAARNVVTKTESRSQRPAFLGSGLLALELLGAGNGGVSGVQWEHQLPLPASASVGRPPLLDDPRLRQLAPLMVG